MPKPKTFAQETKVADAEFAFVDELLAPYEEGLKGFRTEEVTAAGVSVLGNLFQRVPSNQIDQRISILYNLELIDDDTLIELAVKLGGISRKRFEFIDSDISIN